MTLLLSVDYLIITPDVVQSNCTLPVFIMGTIMITRQFRHRNPVATSTFLGCDGRFAAGPVGTFAPYLATASAEKGALKQMMATDIPPASAAQTHAGQAAAAP